MSLRLASGLVVYCLIPLLLRVGLVLWCLCSSVLTLLFRWVVWYNVHERMLLDMYMVVMINYYTAWLALGKWLVDVCSSGVSFGMGG